MSFPLRIFGTRLLVVFKLLSLQQKVTVTNQSFDSEDVGEINFFDFDFGYCLGLLFCNGVLPNCSRISSLHFSL